MTTITRNVSLTRDIDSKTLDLIEELKEMGFDKCYSSIIREALAISIPEIRETYQTLGRRSNK